MPGGAYGLRLDGMHDGGPFVTAPDTWEPWTVVRRAGDAGSGIDIRAVAASLPLSPAGHVRLDRTAATIEFVTPDRLSDEALAHPYLAPAAAIAAAWRGDLSFHGGAFLSGGAAWGVIGGTGDGKSSLLAALADRGVPIASDDLIVINDGSVLAGPRCLDLRADVAAHLDMGENLGVVGARERWRVGLAAIGHEAPLAGFVVLRWGDRPRVVEAGPDERAEILEGALAVVPTGFDRAELAGLVGLPLLLAERRPGLASVAEDAARVLHATR